MKAFEFLCGGSEAPETGVICRKMDVQGEQTVKLRISDISRATVCNIPDLLLDLLEIAAYVYCGDQRARRGGEKLTKAGKDWRRDMRFVIPVRRPDIWSSAELREELEETIGFLSDDLYAFDFIDATEPLAEPALYFPELSDGSFIPDEVALFSGGLDSFAGAVESIVSHGRKTVLVAHHSAPKVLAAQRELVGILGQAGYVSRLMHIPVNVANKDVDPTEPTQRSRSFLFATLAFVIAQMFGKDEFTFYENGVVSLNLPIANDVLGARATRTTHPKVMRGFERIFSHLAGRRIEIRTPFLWLTKKDVIERIVSAGFGNCLPRTVSCVHPMLWTTEVRHCGRCSQCVDRRFAVLAAGAGPLDPAKGYAVDLLTGPREDDQDVRLAVAYLKFCREIATSSRERFFVDFPDAYQATQHVPELAGDSVLDRIWDLHRRHADGVNAVIDSGLQEHSQVLVRDALPRGAVLRLCFSRDRIEAPLPDDQQKEFAAVLDRLEAPVCDFAVDTEAERIWFRGGFCLKGNGYKLVEALLPYHREAKANCREVPLIYAPDLADMLGIEEQALRTNITRVRKEVEDPLAVDLGIALPDGFIENVHGKGYRLAPELREVSRADLNGPVRAVSQTSST